MKIYIVKAPQGEYEDYCEPIVKMFANKEKAEEYIKIENAKKSLKQQVREEVVEEIINAIDDKFNCLGYVEEKFEDVKKYILDQVKGETK